MNSYKVIISSKAQLDISEIVSFVLNVSKEAATDLANTIFESLSSLNQLPERYPVFEMPKSFPSTIRKQVIKNRYIALFAIEKNQVIVYRILDTRHNLQYLI